MQANNSYRQIIRSTSIVGAASLVNVAISLARMKVVAVLLGPVGIGLIGLYQNLIATASMISGVGISNVGTRQIAQASKGEAIESLGDVLAALIIGAFALSIIGSLVFWSLRIPLSTYVLADGQKSTTLGWLSLGVGFTVVAATQVAILQGFRKTIDIALLSITSAALSSLLGVCAVYFLEIRGILLFTLAVPASNLILGVWYLARVSEVRPKKKNWKAMAGHWRSLVKLGVPFMVAGLLATLAQLLVRVVVQKELGASALGNFQAAWQISMTYVGLVLIAMGTDYYPRLTSVIDDKAAAVRMANEQGEVALLLAGPALIVMLVLAPWIIEILYSKEFVSAASILRLQVIGDFLKIASWPLGYVLLASGDGRQYLVTEAVAYGSLVVFTAILLPIFNSEATGIAFIVMYMIYLPFVYWVAGKKIDFQWSRRVKIRFSILLAAVVGCLILVTQFPRAGIPIGLCVAVGFAGEALNYMRRLGLLRFSKNPFRRL